MEEGGSCAPSSHGIYTDAHMKRGIDLLVLGIKVESISLRYNSDKTLVVLIVCGVVIPFAIEIFWRLFRCPTAFVRIMNLVTYHVAVERW